MALSIYGIVASRAIRPLWVAEELGLDYDHQLTDYKGGGTRTPEFLAINPNGHVPAVIDHRPEGDVILWESMACALYIARHHGPADGKSLTPSTPREDAEALRWSFWTMTEVEKDALTVLMHRLLMPEAERRLDLVEAAEKRLAVPLRVLEQHLTQQQARGESFIAAARFTVADLCVASVLFWVKPARELLAQYPLTTAWLAHCLKRPAYEKLRHQR